MRSSKASSPLRIPGTAGFTLLEVLIAMAIMLVTFGAVLSVISTSLQSSVRTTELSTATMLARNLLIESEYKWEGKPFNEIKKEETGTFPEPHQDYAWKREIKEITFPNIASAAEKKAGSSSDDGGGDDQVTEIMNKLVTEFFSKALREVTITVIHNKTGGAQTYSISTYWVNLNNEFKFSQ